jgi:ankyrin repeat protein/L-ascorbate metabolism protein UlaG (beta-lactamase superfamily)
MRCAQVAPVFLILLSVLAARIPALDIHEAARKGDLGAVDSILTADPDLLELRTRAENTPLLLAAWHGHSDLIRFLLDKGADLSARNEREGTAVHYAALFGHQEVLDVLAAEGAAIDARDDGGFTPMTWACYAGNTDLVKRLLSLGADLENRSVSGMTHMHAAAYGGHADVIELLVESGLTCNPGRDEPGNTPLFGALLREHSDAARVLIERGADLHAVRSDSSTALHLAAERGLGDVVALLVEKGADVDVRNTEGKTPLMAASQSGQPEVAELLLRKGADPNASVNDGRTALHEAARSGLPDLVNALLSHGANANARERNFGWSPLHIASAKGYGTIVTSLLEHGADVHMEDGKGRTPLRLAAKHVHKDVSRLLEKAGARGDVIEEEFVRSPFPKESPGEGEAYVWYLGHSGWAVKTESHLLIFDYYPQGPLPSEPSLANGHVRASELEDQDVSIFVTHDHADHYDPSILELENRLENLTYVFGFDPDTLPGCVVLGPRESKMIEGMKVSTIRSDDGGVGYIVQVDGLTLFHAGDHANRTLEVSEVFALEIDHIADQGPAIDIAFLPVVACGSQSRECPTTGVFYAVESLSPRALFPMHAGGQEHIYMEFAREAEQRGMTSHIGCPENRGDRFFYSAGKLMLKEL